MTLGGFIGNPAISPDGRYIAYVSSAGDSQSIWLRQVATSSNAQVVGPSKLEFGRITFSLDGNYLFYFGRSREDEEPGLYEVPVIGGTPKRIIDGGGGRVTFASDHKRLAFVRQNHSGESVLFVANVDGTDQRTLATRKDHDSFENVAWSPDGNRITCTELFDENGTKRWKLLTIELADGSENSIKTPEFRSVGEIVWLADGSGLLMIAATEDEQPQVWQVDYPNGPARKVLNDVGGYEGLSLTADSSVLITQRSEVISNIWNQPRDDFAKARQITSGASVRDGWMGIDWTPDGRIVYSSHASGQPDIWIMNSDGSNPQQLTNNMGSVYSGLAVSPNGQYVVFVSRRAGNTNLWRIDIDGRNPKQLTFGTGEFNPIFAPDGQWVRYGFGGKTWKIPIDGGGAVLSGDGIPPLLGISLSPNGKFRANLPETNPPNINRIVIAPAIGGKSIVLNLPPGTQISRAMCWTPDSRALTYVVAHGDVTNIWSQPVDGGPAHPLTDFKADRIKSFAWSRDGKQLAFVRTTIPVELILVSNFR